MNLTESILAVISVILVMLTLNQIVGVFPSVMGCVFRLKENFNIEDSVKLSRNRSEAAFALALPFILLATHYGLYAPEWMSGMDLSLRIWFTMAVIAVFILLRFVLYLSLLPKKRSAKSYKLAYKMNLTYFVVLCSVLLVVVGFMSLLKIDTGIIKLTLLSVTGLIYLLLLVRKIQIFSSFYPTLNAFLYLCTLEFFPTGLLVVSAVIF